jgi:hypothetical protein
MCYVQNSRLAARLTCGDARRMEASDEPVIYRYEVLAIIGALADLVVDVRAIRTELVDEDGGSEEEAE